MSAVRPRGSRWQVVTSIMEHGKRRTVCATFATEAEARAAARFPPDGATLGVAQIVEQVEAVAGELDRGVGLVAGLDVTPGEVE